MFAVVETGGKQYKVKVGDVLDIEKVAGAEGDKVELKVIATFSNDAFVTGDPVKGAKVVASIVKTYRAPKIVVYKYKPKKNVRKRQGHRQTLTRVKIETVS